MTPRDDHAAALYYARFGILDEQSEPPEDWGEQDSIDAQEKRIDEGDGDE